MEGKLMCVSRITDQDDETEDGGDGSSTSTGVATHEHGVGPEYSSKDETPNAQIYNELPEASTDLLNWMLERDMTDELPEGYRMMRRGGLYRVIDEDGNVVAGPSDDPVGLINDAWTHYKSENGY
jgi:hypothetical protein